MRGVWRQLHHHGSIDEPAMLADYQRVILGAPLGVAYFTECSSEQIAVRNAPT
jgi:hypothetical protein